MAYSDLYRMSTVCVQFSSLALDLLWKRQSGIKNLLLTMGPEVCVEEEGGLLVRAHCLSSTYTTSNTATTGRSSGSPSPEKPGSG